jgi:hypothetical protein
LKETDKDVVDENLEKNEVLRKAWEAAGYKTGKEKERL